MRENREEGNEPVRSPAARCFSILAHASGLNHLLRARRLARRDYRLFVLAYHEVADVEGLHASSVAMLGDAHEGYTSATVRQHGKGAVVTTYSFSTEAPASVKAGVLILPVFQGPVFGPGVAETGLEQTYRDAKLTGKKGHVVAAFMVGIDDEIVAVSSGGVTIRMPVREISSQGRGATGVRVMNLDDGQTVASVAPIFAADD